MEARALVDKHLVQMTQKYSDPHNPEYEGNWADLSTLCKGGYSLNKGNSGLEEFLASDVRQGELGNCYFLASVSALVDKYPSLVSKMFPIK